MQTMSEWREGVYVRVYGALSEFEGKFRILAFNVRKVTDFNEVRFNVVIAMGIEVSQSCMHDVLNVPGSMCPASSTEAEACKLPCRPHTTTSKQSSSMRTWRRVALALACSAMG